MPNTVDPGKRQMTHWERWISQPQSAWLRKAMFQVHMCCGIGIGLYVLLVSVTGSILVYRNELYDAAARDPIVVTESGPGLTDDELKSAATHAYPGYTITNISRAQDPHQAVSISLENLTDAKRRLFNPYTGEDLGDSEPLGMWLVTKLLELHDNLLAGEAGRSVNGLAAVLVIILASTGIVVWWP